MGILTCGSGSHKRDMSTRAPPSIWSPRHLQREHGIAPTPVDRRNGEPWEVVCAEAMPICTIRAVRHHCCVGLGLRGRPPSAANPNVAGRSRRGVTASCQAAAVWKLGAGVVRGTHRRRWARSGAGHRPADVRQLRKSVAPENHVNDDLEENSVIGFPYTPSSGHKRRHIP